MPPEKDTALALFRQGQWAEAEPALAACLDAAPEDADLLRALAQLRFMAQRLPDALALMDRILARNPRDAAALNSRGAILTASGRFAEAVDAFDAALRLDPALVRAHANRAVALAALRRPAEALASAEAALAQDPGNAGALASRGMALMALGRPAEAVPALERAIAADPANVAARLDLASALIATQGFARVPGLLAPLLQAQPTLRQARFLEIFALQGAKRFEEALSRCRDLLEAAPEDVDAALAEGNALAGLGRHEEALAVFSRASAARPDDPDALCSLGKALLALGRKAEALGVADRALARDPRHQDALCNRGLALLALDRHEEALIAFGAARAIGPLPPIVELTRAYALMDLPSAERAAEILDSEVPDDAASLLSRVAMLRVRRQLLDWRDEARILPGLAEEVIASEAQVEPFLLLSLVDSPEAHLAAARGWVPSLYPALPAIWRGERYRHDRIRLGYLSSDLRDHPVGQLAAGFFERHDRMRFETIAIALGEEPPASDPYRARLRHAFDRFIPVHGMGDGAVARMIREMEVDVLVDMNGQTSGARTEILAHRPAPVQAGWLGYPGTSGLDYMDYVIADPVVIPPGDHRFYTERVVTLPDCYLPADDRRQIAFVPSRVAAGLPPQGFVFCAFNARHKIAPATFDIWMRILLAVPGSVLWLSHAPAAVAGNLRREAEARGVAGSRLFFAERVAAEVHLGRQRFADLFLDTLPYNAHTTASDALWAGLPVLTMPGCSFAGRVAASLLTALGMAELIAPTEADYEAMAIALARDPARMTALREKLTRQLRTAPAFDTERFCRHFEDAVAAMHDRAQRGLPPEAFAVPARPPA